jgi:hypothetical protein
VTRILCPGLTIARAAAPVLVLAADRSAAPEPTAAVRPLVGPVPRRVVAWFADEAAADAAPFPCGSTRPEGEAPLPFGSTWPESFRLGLMAPLSGLAALARPDRFPTSDCGQAPRQGKV